MHVQNLPVYDYRESFRPPTRSVFIEQEINKKRDNLGKSKVGLTRYAKPLDIAISDQLSFDLDGPEDCDSGYCFT